MKLSPKTKPKVQRDRYTSGGHAFRWDNGEIAFGKIRRINGKEVREEEQNKMN